MAKARAVRKTEATYAELQKQIEDLTLKAQAAREKEVLGVVQRIREAIAVYGLTQDQLFGEQSGAKAKSKRNGGGRQATVRKSNRNDVPKAAPKFRDPTTGKTWTGNGKRPGWYVAAVEAGIDPQTLAV